MEDRGAGVSESAPPPTNVLGLPIRPLTADGLVAWLVNRARLGARTTVCYANAHTVNLACKDARYRAVLMGSDLLYADGASVVWASRWSERPLPERMTAADYFPRFARRCADSGLSLYMLGGQEGIAEEAAARLQGDSPGLRVVGTHHGYFSAEESNGIVAGINAARADVLVVGMSSPWQECWLAKNAGALNVPVRWCVGALFDYLAGVERRAPAWLCRVGGEWVFRLMVDPVGKWRRYLVGNPMFVVNTLRWRIRGRAAMNEGEAAPASEG
ncbi:MAG: WecB/TagA/CpsF family glycosyltransferase [Phycisphaerae bacterium]|nr:WecB/TagA/CpsF family glycosyltransferase [Phycisphaerae bacterium]